MNQQPAAENKMLPFQDYFYRFDDLGDEPSPTVIRRTYPVGERRQHAFAYFRDRHPRKVEYVLGYVEAYARNGVYDDTQFAHCFEQIAAGRQLDDKKGCHAKLEKLRGKLERQQQELHNESGQNLSEDASTPWYRFRAGEFEPIKARFAELANSVKPRGILGPPEEKEYWALYQFSIRISLVTRKTAAALQQMADFESKRIAVKLTPVPDFDLQEAVLGYDAYEEIARARERLQYWLKHSKMPIISDLIRRHPSFADLCSHLDY